ncbi:uncharacterized protein LOC112203982 [Rosa chinensis]|uniref:uncharacterized protein LOC112203982 n=1 Tax=Rosa chinensis TaxID=74649 RepID=UPI000D089AFC|nr:uncharacterized protein LOC112203982 [Rosa chinensis]
MDKLWMHADRRSQTFELGVEEMLMFALENGCDHGEKSESEWHFETVEKEQNDIGIGGSDDEEFSEDSNEFLRFVEDGDKPLYPGCTRFTKLNGLVKTYNLKAKHGLSDACYSDMLILIGILLPEGNEVPGSFYEAKKTLCALGMDYQKIHACPNDCILYRDNHMDAVSEDVSVDTTAKALTWHADERVKDDKMRHSADSPSWKLVDDKWPAFRSEPRNLRLALSSDGFNPHSSLSSRYSCWPIILVSYNLPPWLCMKRKYMMLTLLISGPKQPGNDIDVYLQPLIDDLKILWDGVEEVYDCYRKEYFKLRAVLFWTINDFPTYGNLSGNIMKGYNACPICLEHTKPHRLGHGKKMSYQRHRRFLPHHHPYRRQATTFDNTEEVDPAPVPLSGEDVLKRVEGLTRPFGKNHTHPPYKGVEDQNRPCWKKKSFFFQLEY